MNLGPVSGLEKEDDGPRELRQNGQHGHHVPLQMMDVSFFDIFIDLTLQARGLVSRSASQE